MTNRIAQNQAFLTNIYREGPLEGHGFICRPPQKPLWERGDYTLSETFGSFGMHCCADAEHQFESFKKIPNFYVARRWRWDRPPCAVLGSREQGPVWRYGEHSVSP